MAVKEQVLAGTGVRTPWRALPARVRAGIEARLGSRVVSARNLNGGFSPGLAAAVRTARGSRVFVKAVGPEPNAESPDVHRREAAIAASLPAAAPAPRLLWSWDEGPGGWVALAFAWAEGRMPRLPWREDELWAVLEALDTMAMVLTPSPVDAPSAGRTFARTMHGWRRLSDSGRAHRLEPLYAGHLADLCALEAEAPALAAGETLLNLDVRRDNLIVDASCRVWVVDWPHAGVGAAWIEPLLMLPSVAMQGGPVPEAAAARSASLRAAKAHAVDAVLAAAAGYFTFHAGEPPPPGLPTLRAFQAAQGEAARAWLARRLGWLP